MEIHVVRPGETLSSIAAAYGVAFGLLARWNGLTAPFRLAVGQSLLILFPTQLHTVRQGESLTSIAGLYGVSTRRIWQLNPNLGGRAQIYPGQVLVLAIRDAAMLGSAVISGYAYPNVEANILRGILPYADNLIPFTYGITENAALVSLNDEWLISLARSYGVRPLLHLSTLTENGSFSSERAQRLLSSESSQQRLADAVIDRMRSKGYEGVDVDFEYIYPDYAEAYARFVTLLRERVNALGYLLTVALAPKTSADQPGVLYEGHNYALLGEAADEVLLMTYEWGYTYSPPMAVAPLASVRRVVEYALTEISAQRILLGFPNYAYNWTLPYVSGESRARLIGNEAALALAIRYGAEIRFDETAATPYFSYTGTDGRVHEVWFEDARSAAAKYLLVSEYGLRGIGFWNFMRPFTAGFALLPALFSISETPEDNSRRR